ncbi:hypothetical protein HELRODRAFT_168871 [Helobdella robusta]|uniref:Uncharacterized protein n=1 Tax=Helobdella robusta TaxID=6412 RepID=T1F129_HELRO|nr:hypothetical protein HELRODRAFT_168871 [Helobdella robusta]ESO08949.1 hypothetical protein HELRODRAFT_168871 [Helobdella robusta]
MNDFLVRCFQRANIPTIKEPTGLMEEGSLRPMGILFHHRRRDVPLLGMLRSLTPWLKGTLILPHRRRVPLPYEPQTLKIQNMRLLQKAKFFSQSALRPLVQPMLRLRVF